MVKARPTAAGDTWTGHFQRRCRHLRLHHEYHRILKNRNILLKSGDTGSLDIWSEKLAEAGARLVARRVLLPGNTGNAGAGVLWRHRRRRATASVRYQSLPACWRTRTSGRAAQAVGSLAGAAPRRSGRHYAGRAPPGRHGISPGRQAAQCDMPSQGSQRSFRAGPEDGGNTVSGKQGSTAPILLLGDMTSELDRERNRNLIEFLKTRRMQVFITTTALQNVRLAETDGHRTSASRRKGIFEQVYTTG